MIKKWISIIVLFGGTLVCAPVCFGQATMPSNVPTIRYLFSIDAAASGYPLYGILGLYIGKDELYILDNGNQRVVITDLEGTFLYQFSYADAGIKSTPVEIAVAEDGAVYVAEEKRVVVINYRGIYQHDMDLSTIPDADGITIDSIAIEGDIVYLGDGGNGRIIALERQRERFLTQFREGLGKNIIIAMDDTDKLYVMDAALFTVFRLDKKGNLLGSFGKVSSLPGGFSMLADITVNNKNGQIIVVDGNRLQVIFFDREGHFLFEFGGPNMFRWPGAVVVDAKERVFVSDGTNKIRVFQVIEEAAPIVITSQPESPPVPAEEPKKDEVAKMVEEEQRLLPVFFDTASAMLDADDLIVLEKDAEWLKKNQNVKINVRGYADERGSDEYNQKLSENRAKAVMDYLVEKGIEPSRLKFVGYGRELTTDTSEEGLAKSRRVDFLVVTD